METSSILLPNYPLRKKLIHKYHQRNFVNEIKTNHPNLRIDFYNYFKDTMNYSDIWNEDVSLAVGYYFYSVTQFKRSILFKKWNGFTHSNFNQRMSKK